MKKVGNVFVALLLVSAVFAAEDVVTAVHGTIKKIDTTSKTIVVTTSDGTEHAMHFLDGTAVHGVNASTVAARDSWHGLKEGSEAVVHYTTKGTEDTALEIDKIGKGGLRTTDGTIKDIDRDGEKLVVKSDDGVDSTFRLTDHAAKDGGKDIDEGLEKGTKVTVYYTEDAGKKMAHFFEKVRPT